MYIFHVRPIQIHAARPIRNHLKSFGCVQTELVIALSSESLRVPIGLIWAALGGSVKADDLVRVGRLQGLLLNSV
jgi:hypothetical protein